MVNNDDSSTEKRDHRRNVSGSLKSISHSKIKVKKNNLTGTYDEKMGLETKKMVRQMLHKAKTGDIRNTQKEALAIYNAASEEASDIDRQIVRSIINKPTAAATKNIDPQIVDLAMSNAISHFIKENGILDEQRKRQDTLNPRALSADNVRSDAENILHLVKFNVEQFDFDISPNISDAERYEHVAPLSDPIELKNIGVLLPRDPTMIKDDLRQLHIRMLTDLPPRDKPDGISLAQAYLKYRRSLITASRQII